MPHCAGAHRTPPTRPAPPTSAATTRPFAPPLNPRHQGEIGLGDAIGWVSRRGLTVSIPLADNQPYDLIADVDGGLARVQVKTATHRVRDGVYAASLQTAGGNQSVRTAKPFDPARVDVVYVITDDGDRFVIPAARVEARRSINLGPMWQTYRVTSRDLSLPRDQP